MSDCYWNPYLDGGIRRGTDILKALALGACAVLVGRPVLWGLAVDGARGVQQVLEILHSELERAMKLAGCPTLASIHRSASEIAEISGRRRALLATAFATCLCQNSTFFVLSGGNNDWPSCEAGPTLFSPKKSAASEGLHK